MGIHNFRAHRPRRIAALVTLVCAMSIQPAIAQTMDYELNQAVRTVDSVNSGLQRLQQNDINGFNRLSTKLNKAARFLDSTESKSHPEFANTVQKWGALQQQMAQIAAVLQAARAQQQEAIAAQQAQQAEQTKQQQALVQQRAQQAEKNAQEQLAAADQATLGKQEERKRREASMRSGPSVNFDHLLGKYMRSALPVLPEQPTPEQARAWASAMHNLRTTQVESDLAQLDPVIEAGEAGDADVQAAKRARNTIVDSAERSIQEVINRAIHSEARLITSVMHVTDLINAADAHDMNQAYRFAGDDSYERNKGFLENALRAAAVSAVYAEVFGNDPKDQRAQFDALTSAREKLELMIRAASEQAKRYAGTSSVQENTAQKKLLAAIAQEYWFNGSMVAESEEDGSIWIDANDVGDITNDGEIWFAGNELGSIEPDGEVWFDGNRAGTLEPNGEVWRDGNQVGLIEQNGTVWINGSPAGEITPFQGEWKRAAIVYYFHDLFVR